MKKSIKAPKLRSSSSTVVSSPVVSPTSSTVITGVSFAENTHVSGEDRGIVPSRSENASSPPHRVSSPLYAMAEFSPPSSRNSSQNSSPQHSPNHSREQTPPTSPVKPKSAPRSPIKTQSADTTAVRHPSVVRALFAGFEKEINSTTQSADTSVKEGKISPCVGDEHSERDCERDASDPLCPTVPRNFTVSMAASAAQTLPEKNRFAEGYSSNVAKDKYAPTEQQHSPLLGAASDAIVHDDAKQILHASRSSPPNILSSALSMSLVNSASELRQFSDRTEQTVPITSGQANSVSDSSSSYAVHDNSKACISDYNQKLEGNSCALRAFTVTNGLSDPSPSNVPSKLPTVLQGVLTTNEGDVETSICLVKLSYDGTARLTASLIVVPTNSSEEIKIYLPEKIENILDASGHYVLETIIGSIDRYHTLTTARLDDIGGRLCISIRKLVSDTIITMKWTDLHGKCDVGPGSAVQRVHIKFNGMVKTVNS